METTAPARGETRALNHYSTIDFPPRDLWVFGYGSLMWDPRMPYRARSPALMFGYHRSLCVYSSLWRGTPKHPGLVLGLDRGGACRGIAYRIAAADVPAVLAVLWEREMREHEITVNGVSRAVYLPRLLPIRLPDRRIRGLAFVADRGHPGYAGALPVARTAQLVATRRGDRGANLDYLKRTVSHLAELGVRDRYLQRVLAAAVRHAAGAARGR